MKATKESSSVSIEITGGLTYPKSPDPILKSHRIVCDGNSLTAGHGRKSWTTVLGERGWETWNFAVGGQTTRQMLLDDRQQIDGVFMPGAVCTFWEGINSFVFDQETAQTAYALLTKYVGFRKQRGYRTAVLTMLPSGNLWAGFEDFRRKYNELIVENSAGADIIVDMRDDPRLENVSDLTYYQNDTVHLEDAGQVVVADHVEAALVKYPN